MRYAASALAVKNQPAQDGTITQSIHHKVLLIEQNDEMAALGTVYQLLEGQYPKADGWQHDCILVAVDD